MSPMAIDPADASSKLFDRERPDRVRLTSAVRLDVLVYADMNSEPVSHFLGFSRLARVQAAFWGNPITTGTQRGEARRWKNFPPLNLYETLGIMNN